MTFDPDSGNWKINVTSFVGTWASHVPTGGTDEEVVWEDFSSIDDEIRFPGIAAKFPSHLTPDLVLQANDEAIVRNPERRAVDTTKVEIKLLLTGLSGSVDHDPDDDIDGYADAAALPPDNEFNPVVDAVYLRDTGDTVHISPECPALNAPGAVLKEIGIPVTDDLDELAHSFDAPVCQTCVRMVAAGSRTIMNLPTKEGSIDICGDRLRINIAANDGMHEIPYARIQQTHVPWLSWEPSLSITYAQPLPDCAPVKQSLISKFSSPEARDACHEAIAKAIMDRTDKLRG